MATDIVPQKQCSICKEYFPPTGEYFHKRKASKDGLCYICKVCAVAKTKKYAIDNPERVRQAAIDYATTHKEEISAYHKEYYTQHADSIKQKVADWVKDNPERKREMDRLYYESNKEHIDQINKKWALTHPAEVAKIKQNYILRDPTRRKKQARDYHHRHPERSHEQSRRYRRENPHKTRQYRIIREARIKNVGGICTASDIRHMFEESDQCSYCGIRLFWNIPADFHIDHIHPISRGGSNNPDNLCLSCEFCNLSKADKTLSEWLVIRGW